MVTGTGSRFRGIWTFPTASSASLRFCANFAAVSACSASFSNAGNSRVPIDSCRFSTATWVRANDVAESSAAASAEPPYFSVEQGQQFNARTNRSSR